MIDRDQLTELLEYLKTLNGEGKNTVVRKISVEFNCSQERAEQLLEEAVNAGFLEILNGKINVTGKGHEKIVRHRESYIHERYGHRGLFARLLKFPKRSIGDWSLHWGRKHGLNGDSLHAFYRDIQSLKGYVEHTFPLTNLKEGEEGIVVYALGGRGLIKRLSEMGLTPGTEVLIKRIAPFYGPIQITVRGSSLALGRGIASKIFVKHKGE